MYGSSFLTLAVKCEIRILSPTTLASIVSLSHYCKHYDVIIIIRQLIRRHNMSIKSLMMYVLMT